MRTITNIFLVNLAIADSSLLIAAFAQYIGSYVNSPVYDFGISFNNVFECVTPNFLIYLCYYESLWTVTLVSVERYFGVCHLLWHRYMRSTRRAVNMVLASWVISALFASPTMLYVCIIFQEGGEIVKRIPKCACFQILLLSGDIQVNPGPDSPNSDSRSRETTDVRVVHGSEGVHGVLLNARSVKNKLLDIQTYVYTRNFQIVGISETWLASHIPSTSILNEFIIFRNDRNTNGGGVLLALSPLLDPIELTSHHSFPNTSSQSVWASINIANKRWLCGVFYRPKPMDMEALDCLEETLTNLHPERFAGTLLLGDFNVDFALTRDPRRKSYFDKLTAISDIFGLQQLVSDYTRTPDVGSPSMIDLVFTSSAAQVFDVQVTEKLATSDHHMVTFSFRGKSQRSQNLRRTFYQYDRADVEQLNNLILNTDWNNIFHDDWPIDRVLDTFTETFFCHINQCIPKVTKRRKFKPWFSSDLKRMSTKKQKAYHKAKRTNSDVDWDAYRTLNNQFTYAKKRAYNSHWEAKFAKNDNLKSFWSFVRAQRAEPDSLSFVINDNQTSYPSDIADGFNKLFSSYFTNSDQIREVTSPELDVPTISHLIITNDMVCDKIKSLSPDKAVGPDDISCRMLKLCSNSISPVLTRIFNISISTGNLPSCWKIANVVPVYKKGNRCDLKNYRPIALTSIVVKMLESFVSDHIRDHLMTNGLMYTDQHGFSPGKSCASALSEAVCEWNKILDRRTSPTPRIDLVSVDYSRAFDSISHDVLFEKLHRTYGFKGPLLNWISSFISNRHQRVVFRGKMSDFVPVLSGVPQGSVLGPLLFNIYVNDLHLHLRSKIFHYADDTFLFRVINDDSDVQFLQNDLATLHWWSENNALQLNPQKCQVMCISRRKNKPSPEYFVLTQNFPRRPVFVSLEFRYPLILLGMSRCPVLPRSAINCWVSLELLWEIKTKVFVSHFIVL